MRSTISSSDLPGNASPVNLPRPQTGESSTLVMQIQGVGRELRMIEPSHPVQAKFPRSIPAIPGPAGKVRLPLA
jgi:hypothetical protein